MLEMALCRYLARRNAWALELDRSLTMDDLVQTACLGVMQAERTYDSARGKSFAGWAAWHVSREVRRLLGWQNSAVPPAHVGAQSLDTPAFEDSEETRLDLLADDSDAFEASDRQRDLSRALHSAIDRLTDAQGKAVVDFVARTGQTVPQAAQALGMEEAEARRAKSRAMRRLAGDRKLWRAYSAYCPSYSTGFSAFTVYGSATERAAMWFIEHEGST